MNKDETIKKWQERNDFLPNVLKKGKYRLNDEVYRSVEMYKKVVSEILEDLKNLDEEAVKRSELLRFSRLLYERGLLFVTDKAKVDTVIEEFENLSNSAKRN